MQKNFLRFLKNVRVKFITDAFDKDGKYFRNKIIFYKQRKQKHLHPFTRYLPQKRKSFEKVIAAMVRSLEVPAGTKLTHFPLVNDFWRVIAPQAQKLQKDRTLWVRSARETSIPKLSRGFKASLSLHSPNRDKEKAFKKLVDQCNGTAEQRFYTEGLRFKDSFRSSKDKEEKELPPPHRCRLSCPLPPEEFIPQEEKTYFSNYQPSSVRFSSLPSEFLPPLKKAPENERITMQGREKDHVKSKHIYKDEENLPDFLPNSLIKNKKNYNKLKTVKATLDQLSSEVPLMKALTFQPESLALNYDSVTIPNKIYKDEVLVQVSYSGVCGTDMFITEGKLTYGTNPVILGHEISGKVYAAGSDVMHVNPGDDIAVNAYTACSVCRYCSRGFFSACANDGLNNSIGISKNGGWAEYVVVKKSQVYKIPEHMGLDHAALVQPLSCVLSALSKLNITYGMDILILGLGLCGFLWASVLHSRGFQRVYMCDKSNKKREQNYCSTLDYTFVPLEDMNNYNVDVIIECTGSPTTIEKAFNILNPNGQMCFFGKPNPLSEVRCIPYEIIQREITLVGNAGNAFCFSKAIDLAASMGQKYLDFEKLGVKVFDLEDYKEAFQMKKKGEVNKIMFKLGS